MQAGLTNVLGLAEPITIIKVNRNINYTRNEISLLKQLEMAGFISIPYIGGPKTEFTYVKGYDNTPVIAEYLPSYKNDITDHEAIRFLGIESAVRLALKDLKLAE